MRVSSDLGAPLPTLVSFYFLTAAPLMDVKCSLTEFFFLICIFLMTDDARRHLVMCFLDVCVFFFEEIGIQVLDRF